MDPITILSAFLPVITDGIRGVIGKFTGGAGAKPQNVDEAIKLVDADIRRLEALSKLDSVGDTAPWVNNVRALQRPVVGAIVLLAWLLVIASPSVSDSAMQLVSNLASSVIFDLFGDRTYLYLKRKE